MSALRILIVDDHALLRAGLKKILEDLQALQKTHRRASAGYRQHGAVAHGNAGAQPLGDSLGQCRGKGMTVGKAMRGHIDVDRHGGDRSAETRGGWSAIGRDSADLLGCKVGQPVRVEDYRREHPELLADTVR